MVQKMYVLPPTEVEDDATGEMITIPKYMDNPDVDGFNTATVPAPESWPGATMDNGDVFIAKVEATQAVHDSASGLTDVWSIGTGTGDDVTPDQAADFLNQKFRPQNFAELKEALGDEYRDLTGQEWIEQLGLNVEL